MAEDDAIALSEVQHVAKLARLVLQPNEAERLTRDMCDMLKFVKKLEGLDTDNVDPTTHAVDLSCKLRPDKTGETLDTELALREAPERIGDGFGVPKVIE